MGGMGGSQNANCYSPDQPDDAYEDGAEGCACAHDTQSVCVLPAALFCTDGAWQAVEDGACQLSLDTCDGHRPTWQGCLAAFTSCIETEDGDFCGHDPL
jgi:hypothetical protein